jgi:ribA/ribD-fused uncharacterized protein|nr:NADAR domain-containing protein [Neorhizobium tomejilense]
MDLTKSMRVTPTHVYFHGGPFSNWYKSDFVAELPVFRPADGDRSDRIVRSGTPYKFSSGEKWMMACKASVMGDIHKGGALETILGSEVLFGETDKKVEGYKAPMHDVRAIKAVGRTVIGRKGGKWDAEDIAFWDRVSVPAVTVGLLSKFSQRDDMYQTIRDMGDRIFVEGSPRDDTWGVKLDWADPRIEDERNWLGRNKLGKVLNVVNAIFDEYGRISDAWKAYAQYHRAPALPKAPGFAP